MAIHMDEETGVSRSNTDSSEAPKTKERPPMKHTDSWLERHRKKQKRAFCCGWIIVLVTILVLLGIAAACLWVFKIGPFGNMR